ncbi:MAG: helicase-related protein, partial [Microgenomates group bacterium]
GLVIYDEQHKFGVSQRSQTTNLTDEPHVLTMTATPIPRSLLLTIFSHLKVSVIDELPPGRTPITTWLPPQKKRPESYNWIAKKIIEDGMQAFIVCPFIKDSESDAVKHVASVEATFELLRDHFKNQSNYKNVRIALLHSKLPKVEQEEVMERMVAGTIDILICTPMIEVGVDIPNAGIILIESAERFGLASLHQLRGRVGRGGHESFCIVFPTSANIEARQRLKKFSEEHDGLKLAELDLKNRGAGDLFGAAQHGELNLQFGSWTNLELIRLARHIFDYIEAEKINYKPFFQTQVQLSTMPQAN